MPRPRRGRRRLKQSTNLRRGGGVLAKLPPPSPRQAAQCGVLVRGPAGTTPPASKVQATCGELSLPYVQTLIWKPGTKISRQAIMRGFSRLLSPGDVNQLWEMLAMLVDKDLLASSIGSKEERARTLEVVGDLRLPVYDVRLLWVRRTAATERVVARWARELKEGANEQHAFLRALYVERAMLCTLPPVWHTS